jgi:transposase
MGVAFCSGCFEKQQKIDSLEEENKRLKTQLRYRAEKEKQGFFGSSTPSSQKPVKPNSDPEAQAKQGGAPPGHPGHGRKGIEATRASRVIDIPLKPSCPDCGRDLLDKRFRERSVLEIPPPKPEPILYRLGKGYCPHCRKVFQSQAPAVLPKALFGNQLTAHAACLHYLHGIPLGRISNQMGLLPGSLIPVMHRLAHLFKSVPPLLVEQYRQAAVRHADETSWRTDGHSGYAWLFCTANLSIFLFRGTRSGAVPREIFGDKPLPGVLVVDRYKGYNRMPCKLQYCYAHLMREGEDLAKEFPDNAEVNVFTATLIPLLATAMHLRSQPLSDIQFYEQALLTKSQIISVCEQPALHLGIRHIQDIFRDNADRLYHWVQDRNVPADNNRAERELRPTVIARKVSFGSQSDEGAKTREILMTVLHTLRKQHPEPEEHFKWVLDQLSVDIKQDPFPLLFPDDSS